LVSKPIDLCDHDLMHWRMCSGTEEQRTVSCHHGVNAAEIIVILSQ